jgi:uncharacterized protein
MVTSKIFKRRVLSIDGGGIRGIIPASILEYIEQKTGDRIANLFDMISGTSTGGIIALGLTKLNSDSPDNKEPEYTAAEIKDFYRDRGKEIFTENFPGKWDEKFLCAKYNSKSKEKVLESFFGKTKVQNAIREIFIPSYDIQLRAPVFFISDKKAEERDNNQGRKICTGFTMLEAAMATSAAPTFFSPYQLDTTHLTSEGYYALIDGGIFANNPTSLSMMQTMISYKVKEREELHRDDTLVVSLGTGSCVKEYDIRKVEKWGQLQWAIPLIETVFDGQSESVAYQLAQLMITKGHNRNYYRFQVQLQKNNASDAMDNTDITNIKYLEERAKTLIEENEDSLNQLCAVLSKNKNNLSSL